MWIVTNGQSRFFGFCPYLHYTGVLGHVNNTSLKQVGFTVFRKIDGCDGWRKDLGGVCLQCIRKSGCKEDWRKRHKHLCVRWTAEHKSIKNRNMETDTCRQPLFLWWKRQPDPQGRTGRNHRIRVGWKKPADGNYVPVGIRWLYRKAFLWCRRQPYPEGNGAGNHNIPLR